MNEISSALPVSFQLPPAISAMLDFQNENTKFSDLVSPQGIAENNPATDKPALSANELTSMADLAENMTEEHSKKIKKAGQDFEAIFFSMMLKEMRNSISSEEGGGLFAGEGSDTYGGMFDMFLGQHLATSSQLGIAAGVERFLGNNLELPAVQSSGNPSEPNNDSPQKSEPGV